MVAQLGDQGNQGGQQVGQGQDTGDTGSQGGSNQGVTSAAANPAATSQYGSSVTLSLSSSTSSSSANSASKPAEGVNSGIIIAGVVGGVVVLAILFGLGVCCLRRRRKAAKASKKQRGSQPISYQGLNSAFAGVPFTHTPGSSPHASLLPAPLNHQNSRAAMLNGAASPGMASSNPQDSDQFMYYGERSPGLNSLGRLDTAPQTPAELDVSPMSPGGMGVVRNASSNTPISPQSELMSPVFMGAHPERDTMGFPIEAPIVPPTPTRYDDIARVPAGIPSPFQQVTSVIPSDPLRVPTPIASPKPRHPLGQQDNLERATRHGLLSQSLAPTEMEMRAPSRLRVLSQEFSRESPILGNRNPVKLIKQTPLQQQSVHGRSISHSQPPATWQNVQLKHGHSNSNPQAPSEWENVSVHSRSDSIADEKALAVWQNAMPGSSRHERNLSKRAEVQPPSVWQNAVPTGLGRSASQRTTGSVMPPVISDEDLERLGVGARM